MASITLTDPSPSPVRLLFVALALAGALLVALQGLEQRPSPSPGRLADGDHRGLLALVDGSPIVVFDPAALLVEPTGARVANTTRAGTDVRLAAGAEVFLFDCTTACRLEQVAPEDFLSGTAVASRGPDALYSIRVEDGEITRVVEVYVPDRARRAA